MTSYWCGKKTNLISMAERTLGRWGRYASDKPMQAFQRSVNLGDRVVVQSSQPQGAPGLQSGCLSERQSVVIAGPAVDSFRSQLCRQFGGRSAGVGD